MKIRPFRWPWLTPLFALSLSSCLIGSFAPTTRQVPFKESDFAGYDRPGTGSISGRVSTAYEGYPYISSGEEVGVIPVTAYTTETVTRELGYGVDLTRSDARLKKFAHYGKTDEKGYFTITGIPPGRYYVIGCTHWPSTSGEEFANLRWSCEKVTLGKGQALRLNVTHNPEIGRSTIQDGFASGL